MIYQLRLTLRGTKPPIWRRLLVPGDTRLSRLHRILQWTMGWDDSHLHAFTLGDTKLGSETRLTLEQVLPAEKGWLRYEYDFGDGWEHDILVEKLFAPQEGIRYPRCLAGEGACPPEDIGGVWGYEEFLEALQDPKHERHEEFMEWAGEFDPKVFNVDAVNAALLKLR